MDMIQNQREVTDYFGYWPQFCDAKFTRFTFDKSGFIEATIFYIDVECSKQAIITIEFSGVKAVKLNDFYSENVIDEIAITNKSPYKVTIIACYGLNGTFDCTGIEVTNVRT